MITREQANEKNPEVFDIIYDKFHRTCVLCGCRLRGNEYTVLHEIVPGIVKEEDWRTYIKEEWEGGGAHYAVENKVVLLCVSCAYKIENGTSTEYRGFLEENLWKKTAALPQFEGKGAFATALSRLRHMNHMKRFGAEVVFMTDYLSGHCFWVPMFSLVILEDYVQRYNPKVYDEVSVERLMRMGLFHDIPEVYTTDVVNPIKKATPDTQAVYEHEEEKVIDFLGKRMRDMRFVSSVRDFNGLESPEAIIANAADKLAGITYALEEHALGNKNFTLTLKRYYSTLKHRDAKVEMEWQKALWGDIIAWLEEMVNPDILNNFTPVNGDDVW